MNAWQAVRLARERLFSCTVITLVITVIICCLRWPGVKLDVWSRCYNNQHVGS
jgi:hypothetical protein